MANNIAGGDKKIKCVVWDLDNTLWEGILLEDKQVCLFDGIPDIIKELDRRGILQSIASKNDYPLALKRLEELNLSEYFLYPQVNWNPKSASIKKISELLNIGIDTFAFIDDQSYERDEVKKLLPEVVCIKADLAGACLEWERFKPRFITEDTEKRRWMYQQDIKRKQAESAFEGTSNEFLKSLDMVCTISVLSEENLRRAEELTIRTNQLNTTGYTYSYDELNEMRRSDQYIILAADLTDKYGSYGKIGLALIERNETVWLIKLFLMSCRVMSRGIGTVFLNYIMNEAKKEGVRLLAEFTHNDVNRMMYITYKFCGFVEIDHMEQGVILENELLNIQDNQDYCKVVIR